MTHSSNAAPSSEVLDMTGLVDYQEGSVVSRTAIDKKAGTVTVIAFAEGQALSEHKPMNLREGQMVIMPSN